ncbi:MAG: DUF484 family protein [Gammaproteobacteria bacterium]|nr:DUF484 family protein [Gammaproteobacteria bacterium]
MTTQHKRGEAFEGISEDAVAWYLQSHPEFFERHGHLLTHLRLPHQTGGSAISLVERQVEILRERNRKLERKLHELVEVARMNDKLAAKILRLARELVGPKPPLAVLNVIESALREDFGADESVVVLFDASANDGLEVPQRRFLRRAQRNVPALQPFDTFLAANRPRCGQIRDAQRDFLFGADNKQIGSVAMVPLGEGASLGLLAIGSRDADRFQPAMSMEFLAHIGELVSQALKPH